MVIKDNLTEREYLYQFVSRLSNIGHSQSGNDTTQSNLGK